MSFPYMSQRDLQFLRLYDAYNDSCAHYEMAMKTYHLSKSSRWQDLYTKLAEEKLKIAKQNMEDAKKEFVEFARVDKR